MVAVGIDGTRRGWVAVALRDGRFLSAFAGSLVDLIERQPDATAFGVDIPIGLPETGWRRCDLEARKLIGARWPSVFLAPNRASLTLGQRPAGVSVQAWNLMAKVREAAALSDGRVYEVHPEVSFATMAGEPLAHPKKTWDGMCRRLELLRGQGIELPALGLVAAPDDVIDAAAAAWTATRIATGVAASVGDRVGRIWF